MQPGSLLSISGSAELTDTYRRGGIPAPLARQRYVRTMGTSLANGCSPEPALPRSFGSASRNRVPMGRSMATEMCGNKVSGGQKRNGIIPVEHVDCSGGLDL